MLGTVLVVLVSLAILFLGGWLFLSKSLYRNQEDKDAATQVV